AVHRGDELLRVGRPRFADRGGRRLDGAVADDRTETRIFVELRLVRVEKALVLGRLNRIPRVAGDPPSDRGFVLQRIEVFGLAAQQVEDRPSLEQSPELALANETSEIRTEQR